jgi:hypothetical protein
MPSLLAVYRGLHLLHAVALAWILAGWWRNSSSAPAGRMEPSFLACGFGLVLIFGIPGPYLEFPADTLAHYIRIGDWLEASRVTEHASWGKWSYFFAFSLVGADPSLEPWGALNLFYTGACLLLSWQYYRLARTLEATPRIALLFVLLQALFLGNDVFGFYRYYGISSTLFAQLGAVAACRVAFELARGLTADAKPAAELLKAGGCLLLLGALIAANHVQGLGIAALGIFAAATWTLFRLRPPLRWSGLALLLLLNGAAVSCRPAGEPFETIYRSHAWFGSWNGFNLLSPEADAFQRAAAILGWTGAVSLIAAIFLLRRNHPVAHLTLVPFVALCLPFPAIPLAYFILRHHGSAGDIVTFHRLLWALPPLLSLLVAGHAWRASAARSARWPAFTRWTPYGGLLVALALAVVIPAGRSSFNRFYHVLAHTPDDLALDGALQTLSTVSPLLPANLAAPSVALGEMYYAAGSGGATGRRLRLVSYGQAAATPATDPLTFPRYRPHLVFIPALARPLYSPVSQVGIISGHWAPQRAAFALRGGSEFAALASDLHYQLLPATPFPIYLLRSAEPEAAGAPAR